MVTKYRPRLGNIDQYAEDSITVVPTQTLSFAATGTVKSYSLTTNGKLHSYTIAVPDFTNAITVTLSIEDADSLEVYSKAAIAKNTTTQVGDLAKSYALDGTYTVKATLSGAAGGTGGDVTVQMRIE